MKTAEFVYLCLIYPLYTYWFASHASLLNENLSYVGNLEGMQIHFIIWAFSCVLALSLGFSKCIRFCIHKKLILSGIAFSAMMFLSSVLLPYLPESYPVIAQFHITLSFAGLILLLIMIAILVLELRWIYLIFPYDQILILIYGIALGIFGSHYMSVNSLVEVFLGIALPIYLISLRRKITKNE